MKLFNTLSRRKEDFVPVKPDEIGIYVCGPTTYNLIHAGNARPYVVFDVLWRFMEYLGYNVKYVQNFTDIDDKIIQKARDENISFLDISNRYIDEFFVDADALNIRRAHFYPRVTAEISGIIDLVQLLVDKNFAYEKNGTVYFISKLADNYGKLSKKNISELEAGARVEANPDKINPSDFVLWKAAKPGEPSWDSPWGPGRPGWHIECSVMARKFLGCVVDIHAGGEDLMFPHHENEIAQSEAEMDGPFVNYWLHNGMLLVDNQKMAKSEGNFFLVRDVAAKYNYPLLRFFLLSVHYRSPLNFSEELLKAAAAGFERIRNCRRALAEHGAGAGEAGFIKAFKAALADDLNTANAISTIFDLVKAANIALREGAEAAVLQGFLAELDLMCDLLGLVISSESGVDSSEIENLISERNSAKAAKNWALADEIRNRLHTLGVVIEDTREGTKWHLTNT
ncbi:MAG: cysteine--tRNA ligase [Clostridiales bacterium]|jgi:cysteinyl-tRNA synthetase|nr:cysteine--tRNA ligase [Clostridiales bacterium]